MLVYLAGPLFSVAERSFNKQLAGELMALDGKLSIILPQERALLVPEGPAKHRTIYEDCLNGVRRADVIVAILDGEDADSGTALEMGYAVALGKPMIGVRTDFRGSEERGVNLMLAFACDELLVEVAPGTSVASVAQGIVAFCATVGTRADSHRHMRVA